MDIIDQSLISLFGYLVLVTVALEYQTVYKYKQSEIKLKSQARSF